MKSGFSSRLELAGMIPISFISFLNRKWLNEMNKILNYLSKHGECLDTEIANGTRIPISKLHQQLTELKAKGNVITCHATRYVDCTKSEVTICRLVGQGQVTKPVSQVGLM